MQIVSMHQSFSFIRSWKRKTAPSITQTGARFWSQMVLAGEPLTSAERKLQFIATKLSAIGSIAQCQETLRTSGIRRNNAKKARQKARTGPRTSTDQMLSKVDCVKKPLVLHSTAAATTSQKPWRLLNWLEVEGKVGLPVSRFKVSHLSK